MNGRRGKDPVPEILGRVLGFDVPTSTRASIPAAQLLLPGAFVVLGWFASAMSSAIFEGPPRVFIAYAHEHKAEGLIRIDGNGVARTALGDRQEGMDEHGKEDH